jgi:hypothetical protein
VDPLTRDHNASSYSESIRIKKISHSGIEKIGRPYEIMPIRPSICAIQAAVQKRLPHRVDITNVSTIEVYTKIQTYLAQNVTLDPT